MSVVDNIQRFVKRSAAEVVPNPLNPRNVHLTGEGQIRLALALGRAWLRPFAKHDWAMYCDAMGEAHMVVLHERDWLYFRKELQLDWVEDQPDIILDEGGLSFQMMCQQGYAYQVVLRFNVECWDAELHPPREER